MQTKKKKIKFNPFDIIITKSGYEVHAVEIIEQYISKKGKYSISFNIPICWNPKTKEREQLKTLKERRQQWSTLGVTITDRIKLIKRPTCKLKPIY